MSSKRLLYNHRKRKLKVECAYLEEMENKAKRNTAFQCAPSSSYKIHDTSHNHILSQRISETLNELPVQQRFQPHNIILLALWANDVNVSRCLLQEIFRVVCIQLLQLEAGVRVASYSGEDWSFSTQKSEFATAFNKIHVPTSVYKQCRPLTDGIKHKASELRTFLLVYFPILETFLDDVYFDHFLLLVNAIYVLSDVQHLTHILIKEMQQLLLSFVENFPLLYGENHVKPVIEDLAHLAQQCDMFGPIVNYDAFGFEAINGFFHDMINGNRNIDKEIANAWLFYLQAVTAHTIYSYKSTEIAAFNENLLHGPTFHARFNMFGVVCGSIYKVTTLNDACVNQVLAFDDKAEYVKYCYFHESLIRSASTAKKEKQFRDTVVQLFHNNIKQVYFINLVFLSNCVWYILGTPLKIQAPSVHYQNLKNVVAFGDFEGEPEIIPLNNVIERLAVVEKTDKKLFVRLPCFTSYS
ncbi:unnamed protein product [Didymodactylos carnosus]|uniref:Uncharacterized protein n=1 Tax=Didymodactylos carnosus TaxID=1234261 RepID=A0A8S2GJ48_9BILA|nr:unnamed protein product [Didymodactylos carnosus]CAF3525624.1 unnamed protein product [Didymodactylos carnosus]